MRRRTKAEREALLAEHYRQLDQDLADVKGRIDHVQGYLQCMDTSALLLIATGKISGDELKALAARECQGRLVDDRGRHATPARADYVWNPIIHNQ